MMKKTTLQKQIVLSHKNALIMPRAKSAPGIRNCSFFCLTECQCHWLCRNLFSFSESELRDVSLGTISNSFSHQQYSTHVFGFVPIPGPWFSKKVAKCSYLSIKISISGFSLNCPYINTGSHLFKIDSSRNCSDNRCNSYQLS